MPVTHLDFLQLAQSIGSHAKVEIDFRNCISKAYYSMYHSAYRLTDGHVGKSSITGQKYSGGMHKQLSSYLSDSAAKDFSLDETMTKQVGLILKQMHSLRILADYRLGQEIGRESAKESLMTANELDDIIRNILQ